MHYKYAVLGNPIAHSLSPQIHTHFAQHAGVQIEYDKILTEDFERTLHSLREKGYHGVNVTVPFKIDAYQCATSLTQSATLAGAANTLYFKEDEIIGDNTDGIGLCNDLIHNKEQLIADKIILIIGAGGASRGIIPALLAHNPKRIMIANRTAQKATDLAKEFVQYGKTCGFGIDKVKSEPVDIIINATSVELGGSLPSLPGGVVKDALFYDLSYGKTTPFMQWAIDNNAGQVYDGWGMLVEQAACSFMLWQSQISTDVMHTDSSNDTTAFYKTLHSKELITHPIY